LRRWQAGRGSATIGVTATDGGREQHHSNVRPVIVGDRLFANGFEP
jgi:hypothetical protein